MVAAPHVSLQLVHGDAGGHSESRQKRGGPHSEHRACFEPCDAPNTLLLFLFVFVLDLPSDPRSSILVDVYPSSSNSYHPVMWMNDSSRMVTDHRASRSTAQPSWHLIWVTSSLVDEGPLCVVQVLGQGGAPARARVNFVWVPPC